MFKSIAEFLLVYSTPLPRKTNKSKKSLLLFMTTASMTDVVAEWSKAVDLGSILSWRRFESCRHHFCHTSQNVQRFDVSIKII